MMPGDLTTLAAVKSHLRLTGVADDDLLARLITSASAFIKGWCNRDFIYQDYSDLLDGNGNATMVLGNFPIQSVTSVTIDGKDIPPIITPGGMGYTWDHWSVSLNGYTFTRSMDNVTIEYSAGYLNVFRTVIPVTAPYIVAVPFLWTSDVSVTGATMPYAVSQGIYIFDSADAGAAITIRYGFVPADVEQVCIDVVCRKFRGLDRIGLQSKGLAGETTMFIVSDLSAEAKSVLNQLRRVVPV